MYQSGGRGSCRAFAGTELGGSLALPLIQIAKTYLPGSSSISLPKFFPSFLFTACFLLLCLRMNQIISATPSVTVRAIGPVTNRLTQTLFLGASRRTKVGRVIWNSDLPFLFRKFPQPVASTSSFRGNIEAVKLPNLLDC